MTGSERENAASACRRRATMAGCAVAESQCSPSATALGKISRAPEGPAAWLRIDSCGVGMKDKGRFEGTGIVHALHGPPRERHPSTVVGARSSFADSAVHGPAERLRFPYSGCKN